MDDSKIIELYLIRDESAITETDRKYGAYCYTVASVIKILHQKPCPIYGMADNFNKKFTAL